MSTTKFVLVHEHQQKEPRSTTITRYTQRCLNETSKSFESLTADIVETYNRLVPEHLQRVHFKQGGDAFSDNRLNANKLRRYIDDNHENRFPADIEEAWVLSLPPEYQKQCLTELTNRYGFLPVRIRVAIGNADMTNTGELMKEVGEALEALAPIMADNKITQDDREHFDHAVKQLNDVITAATEIKNAIQQKSKADISILSDHRGAGGT